MMSCDSTFSEYIDAGLSWNRGDQILLQLKLESFVLGNTLPAVVAISKCAE